MVNGISHVAKLSAINVKPLAVSSESSEPMQFQANKRNLKIKLHDPVLYCSLEWLGEKLHS